MGPRCALLAWLVAYMVAQKPATSAQQLIYMHRYADAVSAAGADALHRAEALKLLGRFDEAIAAYEQSNDPAAREGIALSLAHLGRDLREWAGRIRVQRCESALRRLKAAARRPRPAACLVGECSQLGLGRHLPGDDLA